MSLGSSQICSKYVTARDGQGSRPLQKSHFPTGNPEPLPAVGAVPRQGLHTPADFSVVGVGAYDNRNDNKSV